VLGVRFKITIFHMKYYKGEVRCKLRFTNIIFVILNNVTIFRVCFSLNTFTMLDVQVGAYWGKLCTLLHYVFDS
jgi:hypothetical protein